MALSVHLDRLLAGLAALLKCCVLAGHLLQRLRRILPDLAQALPCLRGACSSQVLHLRPLSRMQMIMVQGYLEEEAVKTYSHCIADIDAVSPGSL